MSLYDIIKSGEILQFKEVLSAGANPNQARPDGLAPIHLVVLANKMEFLDVLLKQVTLSHRFQSMMKLEESENLTVMQHPLFNVHSLTSKLMRKTMMEIQLCTMHRGIQIKKQSNCCYQLALVPA
jgi:hypothetical protein